MKGWCRFVEAKGINANEARALGAKVVALPPGAMQQSITSAEAPLIINRQVTLKVKAQVQHDQKQRCWSLLHNIRQKLTDIPIIIKGGPVPCIVEQSPAMRSRNKITGKAPSSLEKLVTSVCIMHPPHTHLDNIKVDGRAATIYYATGEDVATYEILGYIKNPGWEWQAAPLSKAFPEFDYEDLKRSIELALSEE